MSLQIVEMAQGEVKVQDGEKEFISSGAKMSGRTAYLFDKFVVKFGYVGKQEVRFWNSIVDEEDRQHFAAILGEGYYKGEFFIIQERVFDDLEKAKNPTKEHYELISYLAEKYALYDMNFNDGYQYSETHHNFVINSEGQIKIFDYEQD